MKKRLFAISLLLTVSVGSFAQWQPDTSVNNPVCTAPGRQTFPRSVTDGSGGVITCWQDNRNGDGLYGIIYAQRLDSNGTAQWDSNGILISSNQNKAVRPKIIADGKGGAFIAWIDYRFQAATNNEEADIFAQHVDSAGNVLWQQAGIAVDSNAHSKAHVSLALDGLGGLFLAWDEYDDNNDVNGIYAQHIDSAGILLWGSISTSIGVADNSGGVDAYEPQIIAGGRGGFIAAWYDNRSSNTDDIYAQRIDTAGNRVWGMSDIRVCHASENQMYPQIASNGVKGIIITWQDDRANFSGNGPEYDIYAQSLDSMGGQQWLLPGEIPANSTGIPVAVVNQLQLYPQIVADNQGGAYIAWADRRLSISNELLYLQHLDANGDTLFQANGIKCAEHLSYNNSLFEEENGAASMVYNADSGLTIAWSDGNNILAQRIETSDSLEWDSAGKAVCTAANSQFNPQLVSGNPGNVICVWQDQRAYDTSSSNDDIYASLITTASSLSIASVEKEKNIIAYPNPANQFVHLKLFNIPYADVVRIFDENGKMMKRYRHFDLQKPINIEELPSGVYSLEITAGNNEYRIIVVKL